MKIKGTKIHDAKIGTGRNIAQAVSQKNNADMKFEDIIEGNMRNIATQELERIFKEVDDYGAQLEKRFTLEDLVKYKDALSRFLTKAVTSMLEFQKHDYFHHGSGRDVYAVVKKVDCKVEELTRQLLLGQNDRLAILNLIGDIRGMILELFM